VLDPVPDAIAAIGRGEFVVVLDDADRENECDLICAADAMTAEKMRLLLRHTSGVVCVAADGARLDALNLPLMVSDNTEAHQTAFTVSVDYRHGTTTGISPSDRAATVRALADPAVHAVELRRPGHVFPLRARVGGVLKRAGHTEAGVDLTRLAGRPAAAALCEMVDADGEMMRATAAVAFARENGLAVTSVADLIRFRSKTERLVVRDASASIPTPFGTFTAHCYRSLLDGVEHVALVHGDVGDGEDVLVRVHSECLTGDVFASLRCDCGSQLEQALAQIAAAGRGVAVYLRGHEGRGIGLSHKLRAYALQDRGFDTVDANLELGLPVDSRDYGVGAQILADLGVHSVCLLTNNPGKYGGLSGYGIRITARRPLTTSPTTHNLRYLQTKQDRLGHLLDVGLAVDPEAIPPA
jgi:3,4-dihydroxy 2-butanone 4-phosphate synthase/GTP cyclohydrolase II